MNNLFNLFLPGALALILFSLGLGLVADDFRRIFSQRRAVLLGLLCQVVLLPLAAFTLAGLLQLEASSAVGLIILAACPGGMTSGLLTRLARGDVALSVTLTAISSIATVFTLPFVVGAAVTLFANSRADIELPLLTSIQRLFLLTTLPVVAGMALRHQWPAMTERLAPWIARLANACFAVIVVYTFVSLWPALRIHLPDTGPAVAVLNVGSMLLAWQMAWRSGVDRGGRIAITMECGLQNAALGIFVANTLLRQPTLAVPSVVYALLMNASALGLLFALRWRRR